MTENGYIIVGTEVDQAEYYLHEDGSIDRDKGADGQPLNVEFIGKMMVELSRRGEDAVTKAERDRLEDQVRHAMVVQDFSGQSGGAVLSDAQRERILDRTDVRIEFEKRQHFSSVADRNSRILVVPSDETLEITDALLKARGEATGFRPPLSYEMDRLSFLGMRDWFRAQADEERTHAAKFAEHLLDREARVDLTDIELPSLKIATPLDAFEAALAHEQKISEMIRNLARVADETGDIDSRSLINFFLAEQIEEESTVNDIIDWIKTVGNDGSGLLRIDAKLGGRAE